MEKFCTPKVLIKVVSTSGPDVDNHKPVACSVRFYFDSEALKNAYVYQIVKWYKFDMQF